MQEERGVSFPSFLLPPPLKRGSTDFSALRSQKFHELFWDMNHASGLEKAAEPKPMEARASPPWGRAVGGCSGGSRG